VIHNINNQGEFKMPKVFFHVIKLTAVLSFTSLFFLDQTLADGSDVDGEIVVTAKKLDDALAAHDYYMIGYYKGLIEKRKWELQQQAREASKNTSSDSSSEDTEPETTNVDECIRRENVKFSFCKKQAQGRFTERQANCSTFISAFDHLPIVGGQSYTQCRDNAQAILDEDLSECQFTSDYNKAQCHNK